MALLAGMPLLAAVLGAMPMPHAARWPVLAGLGGSVGQILGAAGLHAGNSLFGLVGQACIWMLAAALAIVLGLMSLGLSWSDWRGAGRIIGIATRYSVSGGAARSTA